MNALSSIEQIEKKLIKIYGLSKEDLDEFEKDYNAELKSISDELERLWVDFSYINNAQA